MVHETDPMIQKPRSASPLRQDSVQPSNVSRGASARLDPQQPIVEVSECDGHFHVYADFRPVLDGSAAQVVVKFAQQGMIIAGGTVQRYLPIPTDALIMQARVTIDDGTARISIPTADSGQRWRSLVMW